MPIQSNYFVMSRAFQAPFQLDLVTTYIAQIQYKIVNVRDIFSFLAPSNKWKIHVGVEEICVIDQC